MPRSAWRPRADSLRSDNPSSAHHAGARRRHAGQLKLWPQPQVLVAFGLSMLKPAFCRPSL
jgi:hypothetical protein